MGKNIQRQTKKVKGIVSLTRYREYLASVTVTTFLGLLFSGVKLTNLVLFHLALVLLANLLAVCFAFMINDIEDAPDDALSKEKATRNPVSAGIVSKRLGYAASLFVAFLSITIYYLLSPITFWLGVTSLILGALYSWRLIRLKRIPVLDLISHGLMLAGLQLGCAFFAFVPFHGFDSAWILPSILVISISIHGELYNEVRDLAGDKKAGITHTVAVVGEKPARLLMVGLLIIAAASLIACVVMGLIPLWFVGLALLFALFFFLQPFLGMKNQAHLAKTGNLEPIMNLSTLSIVIWMIVKYFGG